MGFSYGQKVPLNKIIHGAGLAFSFDYDLKKAQTNRY